MRYRDTQGTWWTRIGVQPPDYVTLRAEDGRVLDVKGSVLDRDYLREESKND